MALFKISKGIAANLATNVPYAKEGNVYYTSDESKFYIDIAGDGSTTKAVIGTNRMPLNAATADQLVINALSATSNVVYPLLVCSGNSVYSTNIGVKNGTIVLPDNSDQDEILIVNSSSGRAIAIQGNTSNCSIQITSGKGIKVAQDPTEAMELATKQYVDNTAAKYSLSTHTHDQLIYAADTRSVETTPNDYNKKFQWVGLKSNSIIGIDSGNGSYSYLVGLRGWSDASGGNAHELAFNNGGIHFRTGSTIEWNDWNKILTDKNYTTILNNTYYTESEIDSKLAGKITGTAANADQLTTARTIALSQDVTGSGVFDGSANLNITTTLANSGVTAGTYGHKSGSEVSFGGTITVPKLIVDAKGRITGAADVNVKIPANPDTHYTSKTVVGQTKTATSSSGVALTNDEIYLNHIENSVVASSLKIQGAGATTVAYDTTGTLTITSKNDNTDTKVTTTPAATTKLYVTGTTSSSTATGTLSIDPAVYLDTVAGQLTATTFKGNLSGNADSATKATQDGNGAVISSTYLKLAGGTMTGTLTINGGISLSTAGLITGKNLLLSSLSSASGDFLTIDSSGNVHKRTVTETLEDLGLSKAMRLIGVATVEITDGSTTNPVISGYTFSNVKAGDVVIDPDSNYEYVWTIAGAWERLGPDSSYSLSNHVHKVTHQPKGSNENTTLTPAGTVTSTWTGAEDTHTHIFTGEEEELTHTFAGSAVSLPHTFVGTKAGHDHTFTGTAQTLTHTFTGNAVSHNHTFTGTEASLPHTFDGEEIELTHTFTGATSNATASYTPAGSITSTFTGSSGNTAAPTNTATTVGAVSVASSEHTHSITAAGTVSKPTFTGSAVTSAGPSNSISIYQSTGVGTLPTLTSSVSNHCLTLTFNQGTLPTRDAVTVPSTTHTHSVTAAGAVSQPTFTGSAVTSAGPSATTSVANTTHIHAFTPAGSVASTFKGTSATITSSYTPSGTINDHVFTPEGTIAAHSYTPKGTLNSVSITPAGSIASHSYTPAGTISSTDITPAGTIAAHSYTPAGTIAAHEYTPAGTLSSVSYTPSGSIVSTFKGTAATHTHTFIGTSETLTTTTGQ